MRAKDMDDMVEEEKSEPYWYRVSYPFFLWPLKWMFMSCTIFMVINFPHLHFLLHICILILISNSLLLVTHSYYTRNTVASKCAIAMMEPKIDLILAQKNEKCENCSFLLKN